jgi:hypothetical protein
VVQPQQVLAGVSSIAHFAAHTEVEAPSGFDATSSITL